MINDDIETIESGYEFLLAYAAQGRPAQDEAGPGPHARPTLEGIAQAMDNLIAALGDSDNDFERVIADDSRKAVAALRFILAQPKIGSEIVDNLNASIHLRAVLTDLFLYSEALTPLGAEGDSGNGPGLAYDASKPAG